MHFQPDELLGDLISSTIILITAMASQPCQIPIIKYANSQRNKIIYSIIQNRRTAKLKKSHQRRERSVGAVPQAHPATLARALVKFPSALVKLFGKHAWSISIN